MTNANGDSTNNDEEDSSSTTETDAFPTNDTDEERICGAILVPEPSNDVLNDRQQLDYTEHRRRLIRWIAHRGKDTNTVEGYAQTTVERRARNIDAFYRWVWDRRDGYTTHITHDDGHDYVDAITYRDCSGTHKSNLLKTLKMYYRWRVFEYDDEPWSTDVSFSTHQHDNPQDYFTQSERRRLREASLDYGSVPHYCSIEPDERRQWKAQLARRFGKPMKDVGRDDFERANGHKVPSLICTSLDAGLRPIEVERAKTSWVDTDNDVLRIPATDSAKNRDNWIVGLQSRTSAILERWVSERSLYDKYDGTDRLWLTRENNPYQSTSLKYLLEQLCEQANIDTDDRQITQYTLRHSTGTYMTREEDLAATKAQLRHRSVQTTMKYDQAPVEDRRNALRRME